MSSVCTIASPEEGRGCDTLPDLVTDASLLAPWCYVAFGNPLNTTKSAQHLLKLGLLTSVFAAMVPRSC